MNKKVLIGLGVGLLLGAIAGLAVTVLGESKNSADRSALVDARNCEQAVFNQAAFIYQDELAEAEARGQDDPVVIDFLITSGTTRHQLALEQGLERPECARAVREELRGQIEDLRRLGGTR